MTNESIRAAFERFWLHIVDKIGAKADKSDVTNLQSTVNQKTQVQIKIWEDDD